MQGSDASIVVDQGAMTLAGRVVLVTGGGRGIGRAITRAFARAGATVVATSRTRQELDETIGLVERDGGAARAIVADVTDRAAVETLVADVLAAYGRVDVLVNNAGSFAALGPVWETDPDLWLRDVTTNLFGTFLCSRAVLPGMIERRDGTIVNLIGGGALSPGAGWTGYASSKAGIMRFTDSLAREVAPYDVFVFALGPGLVRTAMTEYLLGRPGVEQINPGFVAALRSGNVAPPEQAGRLAVFLATLRDPRLSGRLFQVGSDYARAPDRAEDIARDDLFTLRLRQ
jgi:NAD(P)-dependent dehydrogenase (short-subunit alcohol dehydrogenase family)